MIAAPLLRSIFTDRRIGNLKAEFGKFGLDAPTSPGRIGFPHATDQLNELAVYAGPAAGTARSPSPEEPKAETVPTHDGLRTDQEQHFVIPVPLPAKDNPEESVNGGQFRFADASLENQELLAEGEVFEQELVTALKQAKHALVAHPKHNKHAVRRR